MRSLHVVHIGNGSIGLGVLGETNEAEATAATGITVLDNDLRWSVVVAWVRMRCTNGFLNLTELFELAAESLVIRVPCKASDVAS